VLQRIILALAGRSNEVLLSLICVAVAGKAALMLSGLAILSVVGESGFQGFSGEPGALVPLEAFAAVFVAPLLETLLLMLFVWGGIRCRLSYGPAVSIAAALFVPLHGIAVASLMVFPMFSIFASVLYSWMLRGEARTGFWIVTGAHALGNGLSVLWLLSGARG